MRQLAYLYDIFCQQENVVRPGKRLSDMFLRQNFMSFKESVEIYTTKGSINIKASLKQNLLFLIIKALQIIKGIYYTECKDKDATQIDEFNSIFKMWKACMFRDASISFIFIYINIFIIIVLYYFLGLKKQRASFLLFFGVFLVSKVMDTKFVDIIEFDKAY